MENSICLVSGGLDSKLLLSQVYHETALGLIFDCNENGEVLNAMAHCKEYGVPYKIIKMPFIDSTDEVPMRNLVFLSYAISEAMSRGLKYVYCGFHSPSDYDQGHYYKDCSPDFVSKLNDLVKEHGIHIIAPFVSYKLYEILNIVNDVDVSDVQICNYENGNCGICRKCVDAMKDLNFSGYNTFPHFNKTMNDLSINDNKIRMVDWIPLNEFRLYINNRCQKNCDFCSYKYSSSAPSDELNVEEWCNVLETAKKLSVRSLMFSGKEPLIDTKIFPILKKAHSMGFQTHINTNGVTLDKYSDYLLSSPPSRLLVSLNYDDSLISTMGKLSTQMMIQPYIVVLKDNQDLLPKLIGKCIDSGITEFYLRFVVPPIFSHKQEEEIIESLKQYPAKFQVPIDYSQIHNWKHFDQYLSGGIIRDENIEYTFVHNRCQAYWNSLTILHNGTIVGCAKHTYKPWNELMKYSIGNVLSMTPSDIVFRCKERLLSSDLSMCLPRY